MEIRLLNYFVILCEEMNYVRAANRLYISQPTLSQQIKILEDNLMTKLFEKKGNQLTLTKAGELLYLQAQKILKEVHHTKNLINKLTDNEDQKVTLYSSGCHFFTEVLYQFAQSHPEIAVKSDESSSKNVVRHILEKRANFGVAYLPVIQLNDSLIAEKLFEDTFMVVVNKNHPWAQRESVHLKELSSQKLILGKPGLAVRDIIEKFAIQKNILLTPLYEFPNHPPCLDLVRRDIGISILPLSFLKFHSLDSVKLLTIDEPLPQATIGLIYRKDTAFTSIQNNFINQTKQTLRSIS